MTNAMKYSIRITHNDPSLGEQVFFLLYNNRTSWGIVTAGKHLRSYLAVCGNDYTAVIEEA